MSPFEPEANVMFLLSPVMVPASIVEDDVMDRCPPMMMLAKSTDPELMVRAAVEVRAASPEISPTYQFPAVDTALDDERARLPILLAFVPKLASVITPVPEVKDRLDVPRIAPRVMASSLVTTVKSPPRVKAPGERALSTCQVPEAVLVPVVVSVREASFVLVSPNELRVILPDPELMVRV
jgi:hypothetical protein